MSFYLLFLHSSFFFFFFAFLLLYSPLFYFFILLSSLSPYFPTCPHLSINQSLSICPNSPFSPYLPSFIPVLTCLLINNPCLFVLILLFSLSPYLPVSPHLAASTLIIVSSSLNPLTLLFPHFSSWLSSFPSTHLLPLVPLRHFKLCCFSLTHPLPPGASSLPQTPPYSLTSSRSSFFLRAHLKTRTGTFEP